VWYPLESTTDFVWVLLKWLFESVLFEILYELIKGKIKGIVVKVVNKTSEKARGDKERRKNVTHHTFNQDVIQEIIEFNRARFN